MTGRQSKDGYIIIMVYVNGTLEIYSLQPAQSHGATWVAGSGLEERVNTFQNLQKYMGEVVHCGYTRWGLGLLLFEKSLPGTLESLQFTCGQMCVYGTQRSPSPRAGESRGKGFLPSAKGLV